MDGETDDKEVFFKLAVTDVKRACDILKPGLGRQGGGDGWVSLEVDPNIASDTDATMRDAKRLSEMVDRPNVFIKIPATEPGLQAIEDSIAAGIPINVTLIFSLERYRKVAEAYIKGLERLVEDGGDPSKLASVASFFVSRVDTEADKRLDEIGGHDDLKGKLAIANAKLAYQATRRSSPASAGRSSPTPAPAPQRCLWASTSTKNEDYRDVIYVEELIGANTVNTMPAETIKAFQDHGEAAETIEKDLDEAHELLEEARGGRGRLRRRGEDARGRGRAEVLGLVQGAARRRRQEARRAGGRVDRPRGGHGGRRGARGRRERRREREPRRHGQPGGGRPLRSPDPGGASGAEQGAPHR